MSQYIILAPQRPMGHYIPSFNLIAIKFLELFAETGVYKHTDSAHYNMICPFYNGHIEMAKNVENSATFAQLGVSWYQILC